MAEAMARLPANVRNRQLAKTLASPEQRLVEFALKVVDRARTSGNLETSLAPELTRVLENKEVRLRLDAARILTRTERADKAQLVAVFQTALSEKSPEIRLEAIRMLSHLGKAAIPATDALKVCLADAETKVRLNAAKTLLALDAQHDAVALPVVKQILVRREAVFINETLHFVGSLKKRALPLVPELVSIVRDANSPLRLEAAEALLKVDASQSKVALDAADDYLRNAPNPGMRAMTVLRLLGPKQSLCYPWS